MIPRLAWLASLLRLALITALIGLCAQAWPTFVARQGLDALPDLDLPAFAADLRAGQRYAEALLLVDAALTVTAPAGRASLEALRADIQAEREDWRGRLAAVGIGAVRTGPTADYGAGGAYAADVFTAADLPGLARQPVAPARRDAVQQAFATADLMLPDGAADTGTALLRFAHRFGALSAPLAGRFTQAVAQAAAGGSLEALDALRADAARLAEATEPAVALAILRRIDEAAALHTAAAVAARPGGAFLLWVGGREALALAAPEDGQRTDRLVQAAFKGMAGLRYAGRHAEALAADHPLAVLLARVDGGRAAALGAGRAGLWLIRHTPEVLGVLLAALAVEGWRAVWRYNRLPRTAPPPRRADRRAPRAATAAEPAPDEGPVPRPGDGEARHRGRREPRL